MKTALALLACVVMARPGLAQEACPGPRAAGADTLTKPDIMLLARVEARTLRFHSNPDASLTVSGCPAADTTHVVVRTNLPKPVQSGVTYQNVRVELLLKLRLAEADCL